MLSEFELALGELGDEETEVTRGSLLRLSGATRAECGVFARAFRAMTVARQCEVLTRMIEYAEERFVLDYTDLFRCCLDESAGEVRRLAVEGLWEDDRLDLIEPFLKLLSGDPDVSVRAATAASLGRFVYMGECDELDKGLASRIRTALECAIGDSEGGLEVTRRAMESLAFINDDQSRCLIDGAYRHEDPEMRLSALFAMGRSADAFWAETILEELESESPAMCYEAARASGELQLALAVEPLVRLIADPDNRVQEMAVWALGQIGGKRAKSVLERQQRSAVAVLAEAAEQALREMELGIPSFDLTVHDVESAALIEVDLSVGEDTELGDEDAEEDTEAAAQEWPDEFLDLL